MLQCRDLPPLFFPSFRFWRAFTLYHTTMSPGAVSFLFGGLAEGGEGDGGVITPIIDPGVGR